MKLSDSTLVRQVILYLWRVSHGPHIAPLTSVAKFQEFNQARNLQDDIQRVFGESLAERVRNIASGKRGTLLTLAKNVIRRILEYLSPRDVVNLTLLSKEAYKVFNDNLVWEFMCEKEMRIKVLLGERKMTKDWKKIFQDFWAHRLGQDKKVIEARKEHQGGKPGQSVPVKVILKKFSDSGTARKSDNPSNAKISLMAGNSGKNCRSDLSCEVRKFDTLGKKPRPKSSTECRKEGVKGIASKDLKDLRMTGLFETMQSLQSLQRMHLNDGKSQQPVRKEKPDESGRKTAPEVSKSIRKITLSRPRTAQKKTTEPTSIKGKKDKNILKQSCGIRQCRSIEKSEP
ncbi:uncharacterized protein LOC105700437 [Orussus abietinus]|uniref:uncharacterized protein LOC105700437 n=1 Tax=Orussus abietinus TaxID=222816 RepID=UPI000625386D|nr:uncharacterized protein LOC105700437 [Orussus abietinus]